MATKKTRGIISHNFKKYIGENEVKPTLFVWAGGKSKMGGSIDGEMIRDDEGNIVPFHNIVASYR